MQFVVWAWQSRLAWALVAAVLTYGVLWVQDYSEDKIQALRIQLVNVAAERDERKRELAETAKILEETNKRIAQKEAEAETLREELRSNIEVRHAQPVEVRECFKLSPDDARMFNDLGSRRAPIPSGGK